MSHAVWQYELKATTRQDIDMPFGAKILKLAVHGEVMCLWALVDPTQAKTSREFHIYETDELIPAAGQLQYIGSLGSEVTVLHCFEAVRVIV